MILLHIMQRHAVVIWGKAKKQTLQVKRSSTQEIPEGLLINGFIQDEEGFARWAKSLADQLELKGKKVTVIADSTAVNIVRLKRRSSKRKRWRKTYILT
ncbi:MAG: hypothetical protein ACLSA6_01340 [Holdemania massiliensis]